MSLRIALSRTFLAMAVAAVSVACSANLGRFDVFGKERKPGGASYSINESEIATQGGGSAAAPGLAGHNVSHVTIGGSYLRERIAAPGGHSLVGGFSPH